jgi:hypothetical protein
MLSLLQDLLSYLVVDIIGSQSQQTKSFNFGMLHLKDFNLTLYHINIIYVCYELLFDGCQIPFPEHFL